MVDIRDCRLVVGGVGREKRSETLDAPQGQDGSDREVKSCGDVSPVDFSDLNSSVGIVAPAIESSTDSGKATEDAFLLDDRFDRPYGLVRKLEHDWFPMVATARINSGKAQGAHKVIETVASAWRIAVARACAAIFVVSSDLDNLFKVVEQDEEDRGTHFRSNNPNRLPHLQHTVVFWHDIRSPSCKRLPRTACTSGGAEQAKNALTVDGIWRNDRFIL